MVDGANIKDGNAAWADNQLSDRRCVYLTDAHWIRCDNYGMDNKKIKKLILPYTIETADFSNNHLTELVRTQWEGLMNLKKISFQNNFLKKIPLSVFKAAHGLEGIDISYNQLTDLNSSGIFKKNVNIKSFKANNNMLKGKRGPVGITKNNQRFFRHQKEGHFQLETLGVPWRVQQSHHQIVWWYVGPRRRLVVRQLLQQQNLQIGNQRYSAEFSLLTNNALTVTFSIHQQQFAPWAPSQQQCHFQH